MDYLQDILAAAGVVLNGIPQGLLAISMGFASVPTALGFAVGVIGCLFFGAVAPISFQAETIVLAGSMGKNMRERFSMVFFAGIIMIFLGVFGLLNGIVNFAGDVILNAMMAGVGLMLTKVSLNMLKENPIVGIISVATAVIVYFFFGKNLVYTIVASLIISSLAAKLTGQSTGKNAPYESPATLRLQLPVLNLEVLRGALALACLTIGANIAFGSITGSIAGTKQNIDHLTIYSGVADALSALFGGAPVEAIISATASAPHPVASGVLMMAIMAILLFCGFLPKIGRHVPSQSIAGFLLILGAVVTVPVNAGLAFSGTNPSDSVVAGVTMGLTAFTDPFLGMIAGIALKLLLNLGLGL